MKIKFHQANSKLIQVRGLPLRIELSERPDGKVVGWFLDYTIDRWRRTWGSFGVFANMHIACNYVIQSCSSFRKD